MASNHINLTVKIKAGPRTPTRVEVYTWQRRTDNPVLTFANGRRVDAQEIAQWIADNLTAALKTIEAKSPPDQL